MNSSLNNLRPNDQVLVDDVGEWARLLVSTSYQLHNAITLLPKKIVSTTTIDAERDSVRAVVDAWSMLETCVANARRLLQSYDTQSDFSSLSCDEYVEAQMRQLLRQ